MNKLMRLIGEGKMDTLSTKPVLVPLVLEPTMGLLAAKFGAKAEGANLVSVIYPTLLILPSYLLSR